MATKTFTIKPLPHHRGMSIFAFNVNEFNSKKPEWRVVLRPTAVSFGLARDYFFRVIRRTQDADLMNEVEEYLFAAPSFACTSVHAKDGRGSRERYYQTLPIRSMEAVLSTVRLNALKNPEAKKRLAVLQKDIRGVISAYYHDGGVLNPTATKKQVRKIVNDGLDLLEKDAAAYARHVTLCRERGTNPKMMDSAYQHAIFGGTQAEYAERNGIKKPHRKNLLLQRPEVGIMNTTALNAAYLSLSEAPGSVQGDIPCAPYYSAAGHYAKAFHEGAKGATPAQMLAVAKLMNAYRK